jgi:hypothetical protein
MKAQARCSQLTPKSLLTKRDSQELTHLQTPKPLLERKKQAIFFTCCFYTT